MFCLDMAEIGPKFCDQSQPRIFYVQARPANHSSETVMRSHWWEKPRIGSTNFRAFELHCKQWKLISWMIFFSNYLIKTYRKKRDLLGDILIDFHCSSTFCSNLCFVDVRVGLKSSLVINQMFSKNASYFSGLVQCCDFSVCTFEIVTNCDFQQIWL